MSLGSQMPFLPDDFAQVAQSPALTGIQALSPDPNALFDSALTVQNSGSQGLQVTSSEQPVLWPPCSWNANAQANAAGLESTTGCSIAFSMLLSNNSRGYTLSVIDTRLQAAYRSNSFVPEGCSVLNKTLFQLLGEIS